jgi:tRNA pseudouridine38-40 synthase
MARYQVKLAYDGSEFKGFQRQSHPKSGRHATVQGCVEDALRQLGWQDSSILFAGRTDSGVHALGQVIAFDLDWEHEADALRSALNALLPPQVSALSIQTANAGFHPRFAAIARRYRYRIFCQAVRNPLKERYVWRVWPAARLERLQEAAALLLGEHDFAAYGTPPRAGGSTVRNIMDAHWKLAPAGDGQDELHFEITGNAFLYHMVRRLVSFQVKIGQGQRSLEMLVESMQNPHQRKVQGLAPPNGLTLMAVDYPGEYDEVGKPRTWMNDVSGEGERGKNLLPETE